jgi:hypothetical protein
MSLIVGGLVLLLVVSVSAAVLTRNVAQDKKSLSGEWALSIALDGDESNQTSATAAFQEVGNKLSGKVIVTDVVATPTGPQRGGNVELALDDLKYNGKTLSFSVKREENELEGELTKVTDELFEGRWKSPVSGRWKGSKKEFTGTLKMTRAK